MDTQTGAKPKLFSHSRKESLILDLNEDSSPTKVKKSIAPVLNQKLIDNTFKTTMASKLQPDQSRGKIGLATPASKAMKSFSEFKPITDSVLK